MVLVKNMLFYFFDTISFVVKCFQFLIHIIPTSNWEINSNKLLFI